MRHALCDQHGGGGSIAENLPLPEAHHTPSVPTQSVSLTIVSDRISGNLRDPERPGLIPEALFQHLGSRFDKQSSMPEVTVHKHDHPRGRKDNVWTATKDSDVRFGSKTFLM